jgi:hypothetical protein
MAGDKYIAAPAIVKGTKEEPEVLPHGGGVQHDNVAIEMAVPYATSRIQFMENMALAFKDMSEYLPKGVNIAFHPSAFFTEDQLQHPATQEFGCHPDMNAWLRDYNPPPEGAAKKTFRSFGGHIHIGWVKDSGLDFLKDDEGKFQTIRMCDATHGMISTLLDNSEEAIARRQLYGKAGCMRPTDYGVEYRTLSNYWTKHPILVGMMWLVTEDMLTFMHNRNYKDFLKHMGHDDIQMIINEGNVDGAAFMMGNHVADVLSDETQQVIIKAEEVLGNG